MNTRHLLAAPALALVMAASPAVARDDSTQRVTEQLRDPATQRAIAGAVAAMGEAMLDMPLEPLARMADAMGDRRTAREMRGATVGDYAGPEARDMPREMSRKLPALMGQVGGMAAAAEEMTPALKAMAREMGARMKEAMRNGARDSARGQDRDYGDDRRDDRSLPSARDESPDGGSAYDDTIPSAQEEAPAPLRLSRSSQNCNLAASCRYAVIQRGHVERTSPCR